MVPLLKFNQGMTHQLGIKASKLKLKPGINKAYARFNGSDDVVKTIAITLFRIFQYFTMRGKQL